MPKMIHRTTFALDQQTAQRLRRLATRWNVSQAEVVRRAVAGAEQAEGARKPDPVALLKAYHARGGLDTKRADRWIKEVDEDRSHSRRSS